MIVTFALLHSSASQRVAKLCWTGCLFYSGAGMLFAPRTTERALDGVLLPGRAPAGGRRHPPKYPGRVLAFRTR